MTTYRVGPAGATVFSTDGKPLCRLRPGQVVVEGVTDAHDSAAAQHADLKAKRRRGYANKRLDVDEDKRA